MSDLPVDPEKLLSIVVQLAALLFSVSFHESAHGWAALRCGDTTARDLGRITLNPLKHLDPFGSLLVPLVLALTGAPVFGWARPVPVSLRGVRNPRRANLLISAAGPLSNLVLAVVAAGAFLALRLAVPPDDPGSLLVPLAMVAFWMILVNVTLGVFNLIPIPPLDGFGVVESLLPARALPAVIWLRRYGFILLVALVFTGALSYVLNPPRAFLVRVLLGGHP